MPLESTILAGKLRQPGKDAPKRTPDVRQFMLAAALSMASNICSIVARFGGHFTAMNLTAQRGSVRQAKTRSSVCQKNLRYGVQVWQRRQNNLRSARCCEHTGRQLEECPGSTAMDTRDVMRTAEQKPNSTIASKLANLVQQSQPPRFVVNVFFFKKKKHAVLGWSCMQRE